MKCWCLTEQKLGHPVLQLCLTISHFLSFQCHIKSGDLHRVLVVHKIRYHKFTIRNVITLSAQKKEKVPSQSPPLFSLGPFIVET